MTHNNTYSGIQALHFVAAMLVVLTHATGMVGERMLHLTGEHFWRPGMSGVDMFFVISGFVMAISSRGLIGRNDAWKIFLTRRLFRIVPLYWFATTFKIALVIALPSMALNTPIEFWHTVASYLFIPTFDSTSHVVFPVLKVGWTLNYEMLFYTLFALSLFIRQPALKITAAIFSIFTAINIFSDPSVPFAYGFLNPIMLEFVMGMLVAEFCRRGYSLNIWLGAIAVVTCFVIMFSTGDLPIWWRWAYWGLPSMVIVAVVALSEPVLRTLIPKILATLGDSSYSLYLFHTFTVPLLGTLFVKFHLASPTVAVVACMVISPIICLAIYKALELPMTNWLKQFTQNGSARQPIAGDIRGI